MKRLAVFPVACAFVFLPLFDCMSIPASAASQTVTLTSAQTLALFGNSIEISYATPGENGNISYSSGVAVYNNSAPYGGDNSHIYSPEGQSFIGREFLLYRFSAPDLTIRPSSISVNVKTSVDISSVDYIDTAICPWVDSGDFDVSAVLYGSRDGYWHCSDGDHYALHQDQIGQSGYNLYGYLPYSSWVMIPFSVCSFPSSSFSFGWWSTNLIDQNGDGNYYFAIFCPVLSENWVYSGNEGAGAGGDSSGGDDSGSGSADLSGIIAKLDRIIALMEGDSSSSQIDYNSQFDRMESAINPEYDSSRYDDVGSAAGDYMSAQDVLKQDSVFGIEGLDSLDLTYNPKMSDHKIDIAGVLFEQPIVIFMLTTVLALSVISYIIFGKFG